MDILCTHKNCSSIPQPALEGKDRWQIKCPRGLCLVSHLWQEGHIPFSTLDSSQDGLELGSLAPQASLEACEGINGTWLDNVHKVFL